MAGLVGRTRQLGSLHAAATDALEGRGRTVVLLGEAGIGKTRMTEALGQHAVEAGMTVSFGRCTEAEAPPYWPWRQALRTLSADAFEALTGRGSDTPGTRDELFASVADAVGVAAAKTPAVIVIEDFHWADASSLAFMRFMVDVAPAFHLLFVATARDDPLELGSMAATLLRDLPPSVLRLPLSGLDIESTALVAAHAGMEASLSPDLLAHLHARTGGNPFFIREVATLRSLQGDRPGFAVPPGVRHVLERRLARLPQATHQLLAAASIAGDEFSAELLAVVTAQAEAGVRSHLDDAVAARLLVAGNDGPGRTWSFAHALVRETLYESQSPAAREELHGRTAEALEDVGAHSHRDSELEATLASHWLRVDTDEARRKGGAYALAAAENASRRLAFEQAARYFRWALDAQAGDRLDLTFKLGEAQVLAGELAAGRASLREAADLALSSRRADELARAVLAMGGGVGGFEVEVGDAPTIELLEQALQLLPPDDGPTRAAVLARLAVASMGRTGEARRIELARAAVGMAARVGDPTVEVGALAAYCDAISGPDHVGERTVATARMIELALQANDPRLVLLARRTRLLALLEQGDFAAADVEIDAYADVAERLRLPLYLWWVPIWRGMRALMAGDADTAWQLSTEAEELGRRAGSLNAELMVFTLRLAHGFSTGDMAWTMAQIGRVVELVGGYHVTIAMVGTAAFDADPALSAAMFERARAAGIERFDRDAEWLEAVWMFGEAARRHSDTAVTKEVYDALVPYADLWAIDGIGGSCFGVVAHQLGKLASALDRRDDAERWLRQALVRHREAGAHLLADFTAWELATLTASPAAPPKPTTIPMRGELRRDGGVWRAVWRGESAIVPDSKGMRDLATLLARPNREIHVLDLVGRDNGRAALRGARPSTNDGPVLDARARTSYKARLVELEADIAEAEEHRDLARASALGEERDMLAAELGRSLGLGGRKRLAGDQVERARKAVAMRITTALRAIGEVHPGLARHLRASVATGRFCVYRPEEPVTWAT